MGLFSSSKKQTNIQQTDYNTYALENSVIAGGNYSLTQISNTLDQGALQTAGAIADGAFRAVNLAGENTRKSFTEAAGLGLQSIYAMESVANSSVERVADFSLALASQYAESTERQTLEFIGKATETAAKSGAEISRAYDAANNRDFQSVENLAKIGAYLVGAVLIAGFFRKGGAHA